jgi:protein phosphatase 2C family protein 2/3
VSPRTAEGAFENTDYIVGPIRVLPGRLSVSRTFGDPEAKFEFRGGNPNVVVCKPDI